MNHSPSLAALTLLLLGPAAAAQIARPSLDPTTQVEATLLVRGAPTDVILNQPLLVSICNSPAAQKAMADAIGWSGPGNPPMASVESTAPHPAGVFQFRFGIQFDAGRHKPTAANMPAALTALLAVVKQHIDQLMYEQPRADYGARADELQQRLDRLQAQELDLRVKAAGPDGLEHARELLGATEQKLLDAQVEVATERAALEQLQRMRKQSGVQVQTGNDELRRLDDRLTEASNSLGDIDRRMRDAGNDPAQLKELPELKAQLLQFRREVADLQGARHRAAQELLLPQQLLEQVLQQLTTSTIALQRAEARHASLQELLQALEKRLAEAQERDRQRGELQAQADRIVGDAVIVRQLLTEVRGRLERLQPVRYEVF